MTENENTSKKSESVSDSADLLAPILEYVRIHDTDTLRAILPDSTIIAATSGSWTGSAHITLGDLRKIALMANKFVSPQLISMFGQHVSSDDGSGSFKTADGYVEYQQGDENDPFK